MDKISQLPDDVLLSILSVLPVEDVVTTMFLSKRWKFLWMFVPKLEFDYSNCKNVRNRRVSLFINNFLQFNEAPVLDRLCFKFDQNSGAIIDIGSSSREPSRARKRSVRELSIEAAHSPYSFIPTLVFFSTSCIRMLATLNLTNAILIDVNSRTCFPSLKKLSLTSIKYRGGDEFVNRFLSSCPVLEDLDVKRCKNDKVKIFTIRVPSLENLRLTTSSDRGKNDALGCVIDAPSLKFLDVGDYSNGFCFIEKKMPKIVKAYLNVDYSCTKQLLGPIASVEQLYLCSSTSTEAYHEGIKYSQLVRLELCTCQTEWLNLLMRLLKDSPKLRFLKLEQAHEIRTERVLRCWSEPSYVPECLSSSLETFEWIQYEGREEEKQVARFILRSSSRLKTATFYHKLTDLKEKVGMLMELLMLPRSSTCELAFKESHGHIPRNR